MNTPTPRTNRFYASFADGECIPNQDEWLALCESLESELTAARQEIDMLKSKYADHHAEAERLTSEINAVTEQRDRLADATITHRAKAFPLTGEDFDQELWQALAAVKGGSDDRPILRHNGVGEADMYSEKEYAQLMLPQSIPTAKVTDIHFLCIAAVLEPGQWVDWEVAFTYQGEACLGFLQACPAHPYLMHHHQIENCCHG
jgi:hypothetical protein